MIVKILYTRGPNGHFPAVGYNTGKMDKNKGELVKVANFGALQGLGKVRPEDFKNYLKMVSATNKTVTKPQFHVAISCAGKSYDKDKLTEIASQWMERMGYGMQPYLIVYHSDTGNNHVHIISTRIDKQGIKIRDSYEQIRGQQQMNMVLGRDEKVIASTDLEKALSYRFSTKAQFLMILESMGYGHKDENGILGVFKYGRRLGEIAVGLIERSFSNAPDDKRRQQLKALFHKYAAVYATELVKGRNGFGSDFSAGLKEKFGLELVFHASGDKQPYGYTVIDHAEKMVFKGGEIMPLKELLAVSSDEPKRVAGQAFGKETMTGARSKGEHKEYYAAILKAALMNYPDLKQGLKHQGLVIIRTGEIYRLYDPAAHFSIDTKELLSERAHFAMVEIVNQEREPVSEFEGAAPVPGINISQDIDDEAIHGRNRKRKKKARTNTR